MRGEAPVWLTVLMLVLPFYLLLYLPLAETATRRSWWVCSSSVLSGGLSSKKQQRHHWNSGQKRLE